MIVAMVESVRSVAAKLPWLAITPNPKPLNPKCSGCDDSVGDGDPGSDGDDGGGGGQCWS